MILSVIILEFSSFKVVTFTIIVQFTVSLMTVMHGGVCHCYLPPSFTFHFGC